MSTLMEKIADNKKKKPQKPKQRKAKPTQKGKPKATAPKATAPKATAPKATAPKTTLHDKVDSLAKKVSGGAKKVLKKPHMATKLGLIGAGVAGASALVHKVRQKNLSGEAA